MSKSKLQRVLSMLLLVVTLGVVLYIGLNGNNLTELADALQSLSPGYLLLCFFSWALYILSDALAIHHYLFIQQKPIKFWQSLHSAVVGIYYCNVTPGATGGQPMQMYCLSKYDVPVGLSGSAVAVKFIVFQAVLLVTGAFLWGFNAGFVAEYAASSRWFVLLGYVVNFFSIGMVVMMAVSQNAVRWVIERCIRIGARLKICKNPQASREKWQGHCSSFLSTVQNTIRRPMDLAVQCLIALMQLMSLMVVILAIYYAFGLQGVGASELITMGVLLYIAASYTPLPGASGAQEGGFALMFSKIFPQARCFVALMIWRFSTYYLSILVGAVVETITHVRAIKNTRKAAHQMQNPQN